MRALRFWLVAAIMRASVLRTFSPPTFMKSRDSMTRSSLLWRFGETSPTSSRKSVPFPAISNLPLVSLTASVKAPLTCPKSSLSSRVSWMAEQLMTMKGSSR